MFMMDMLWNNLPKTIPMAGDRPDEALNLLNIVTGSGVSNIADTTSLLEPYAAFFIVFENISTTLSRAVNFRVQSGGSFQATSYVQCSWLASASALTLSGNNAAVAINLMNQTLPAASAPGLGAWAYIFNPQQTSTNKMIICQVGANISATSAACQYFTGGYWSGGTGAITGFQILPSGSNNISGTFRVYGING